MSRPSREMPLVIARRISRVAPSAEARLGVGRQVPRVRRAEDAPVDAHAAAHVGERLPEPRHARPGRVAERARPDRRDVAAARARARRSSRSPAATGAGGGRSGGSPRAPSAVRPLGRAPAPAASSASGGQVYTNERHRHDDRHERAPSTAAPRRTRTPTTMPATAPRRTPRPVAIGFCGRPARPRRRRARGRRSPGE